MQAACNLHAGCMHAAATCNLLHAGCCILQPPAYRRNAACMQPACISSVALALHAALLFSNFTLPMLLIVPLLDYLLITISIIIYKMLSSLSSGLEVITILIVRLLEVLAD